jgi:hypothetical protein
MEGVPNNQVVGKVKTKLREDNLKIHKIKHQLINKNIKII